MVAGRRELGGGTSPSKVYAKRERTADFLLAGDLSSSDPQIVKVGLELFGRLEYDGRHAKPLGSFSVGGNVVNINGLFGADFAGAERFPIDERIGFTSADRTRVNPCVKEAEKIEAGLHVCYMEGISVGKNSEAIALAEPLEERVVLDGMGVEGAIPEIGRAHV